MPDNDNLIDRFSSPFIEVESEPNVSVKPRKLIKGQDPYAKLRKSGIAYRSKPKLVVKKIKSKLPVAKRPEVFTQQSVDVNKFRKEYIKKYKKAREFWFDVINESLAFSSAMISILEEIRAIPEFEEISVSNTNDISKLIEYNTIKKVCEELDIDYNTALTLLNIKHGETDKQLLQLRKILKMRESR